MDIKTGISAIANEIITDIQKEAENNLTDAQNQAKETLQTAHEKAKETYHTLITDAKKHAETEKNKHTSATEVEMRNYLLQTKEDLVDKALNHATEAIQEFTKTPKYHNYLLRLIQTTAEKLAQPNLLVYVNTNDKTWLTKEMLSPISKKLHIELQLAPETLNIIGGCKIQLEDGKISYDATFDSRLQELKSTLRSQIITALLGDDT
ncbi:V-type ATP synthase subunit E family protein [Candidatus Bathycorpusculum sp.]|uniref:V-type ATP synthase subunit E n=1 Tax=Candidatus Bathycorpusculum sp. TaxID=2994959 RepID=UPI00282ADE32|nr:V-type ATP synthase subunit E family protein [Candidatus Termitimicrobium sp.]MCL2685257.1 V-type ATP synthase subunit E family protein [Candidatus Termitimicrobium sp.]